MGELTRSTKLFGGKRGERRLLKDLQHNQQRHDVLYSTLLQIAHLRRLHALQAQNSREVIEALRPQRGSDGLRRATSRIHSVRVFQTTIASIERSKRSFSQDMRPLWVDGLATDFALDDGIPYSRHEIPRVLLVESWPTMRGDPNKAMRGAAFGNWLMAVPTTAGEIEDLLIRTMKVVKKRLDVFA